MDHRPPGEQRPWEVDMWITGRPVSSGCGRWACGSQATQAVGGGDVDHRPPGEQRPWEVEMWITGRPVSSGCGRWRKNAGFGSLFWNLGGHPPNLFSVWGTRLPRPPSPVSDARGSGLASDREGANHMYNQGCGACKIGTATAPAISKML